jgi:hypothetical protein
MSQSQSKPPGWALQHRYLLSFQFSLLFPIFNLLFSLFHFFLSLLPLAFQIWMGFKLSFVNTKPSSSLQPKTLFLVESFLSGRLLFIYFWKAIPL